MRALRTLLVLPPLTQLNTPYPSTGYLLGALRAAGRACEQRDLGIELILKLYSREGLRRLFDALADQDDLPEPAWRALALRAQHEACIDGVIRFLQGRDRGLAPRILDTPWLPRGPRTSAADLAAFGRLASDDAARRLATLHLADLADLVESCVDPGFGLARYQHHLAAGPVTFDPLAERLAQTTLVDELLDELTDTLVEGDPAATVVGLSVPFPGNLYGALRIGQRLRARGVTVLMGGGYVNTELREVEEPRLWGCVDALMYDDGEGPLLAWLDHAEGKGDARHRTRTAAGRIDRQHADTPAAFAADYDGLEVGRYLQLVDSVNPAHRLWSDGRWNKLTVAHGCYWKRCSFCDIQLDYIARYAPARTVALVDAMERQIAQTGQAGFHLVDEAAPPRGVRDLALELLRRGVGASFWGNVRFERAWTPDLARLCAAAGLVLITGGLEVASDRLLDRMEKGVTIEQVVASADALRRAGVMVHAYLMYGFPTETEAETVDAMEVTRQLFAAGLLRSAFWHRFVLTRHSGMVRAPETYGLRIRPPVPGVFAANDLEYDEVEPSGADPDAYDAPLSQALAAWMRGEALDRPVHTWFPRAVAPTREDPLRVARLLAALPREEATPGAEDTRRLVWLGAEPLGDDAGLALHHAGGVELVRGRRRALDWLAEIVSAARPTEPPLTVGAAVAAFPGDLADFSSGWAKARRAGLVAV